MGGGPSRARTDARLDVEVRAIAPDDVDRLAEFFAGLPEGDRTFFREDVTDTNVIAGWAATDDRHRLIAVVGDELAGYVAVLRGVEWSRHVGELRLAVTPAFRQRGIGRLLAQRAVVEALELGVVKLVVDVVEGQDRLHGMFTKLGFEQEGRLRRHVRDATGQT
ncbi:MAG: GNAT family N-acetyltransferase, partial [Acidimicrobiales bacterium]